MDTDRNSPPKRKGVTVVKLLLHSSPRKLICTLKNTPEEKQNT
ncbi:hypothetical protein [Aquimarina sp. AU474]|nr:hypothetical protein [Aquimarina sp. AU474]